jgi:hypothetical protein
MKNLFKKLLIITLLTIQVGVQTVPAVFAQESTPDETPAVTAEQPAQQDPAPTVAPSEPVTTPVVTPTPTPYIEDETDRAARLYREQLQQEIEEQVDAYLSSQGITPPERNRVAPTPTPAGESSPAALTSNSSEGSTPTGVGDVEIDTGDATSATQVQNLGNNNLGASTIPGSGGSGATVANSKNGTNSDNSGSAVIDNSNTTNQSNSASVNTNLNSSTVTGDNTASDNVGDASINTGDANTTGTVLTMVNTNAQGVMVSEFNILDDQIGDVVLDFAANCVLGCAGPTEVINTGNGSNSNNSGSVDTTNTTTTNQENDAQIGNDLVLSADTGNNAASANTGGDSSITTGDANVAANVLTFANNNIAGNVIYGIVNIFGDLIGDIIFPEDQINSCCAGSLTAKNTGNGSGSTNASDIDIIDTDNTFQSNTADITNNLIFDANTGENAASRNTGGDSSVTTGDTNIDVNLLNIANTNLAGGNWWIVMVNDIAKGWIGKIMGSPDDAFFAGSEGSDFQVDENGYITATNNKNGTNSTNDTSASVTNTNTTNQTNNADIDNNLKLTANTGGNQTSDNTGGNSNIKTGDATIVANMINFVNNNIKGNGKVFVTVVNVFGTWLGDFVSPGQKKTTAPVVATVTQEDTGTQTNDDQSEPTHKSSSPTPTPSAQARVASTGSGTTAITTGGATNNSVLGSSANSNDEPIIPAPLVKGASLDVATVLGSTGKVLTINLAWLLLALPLVGLAIVMKKRLSARKSI